MVRHVEQEGPDVIDMTMEDTDGELTLHQGEDGQAIAERIKASLTKVVWQCSWKNLADAVSHPSQATSHNQWMTPMTRTICLTPRAFCVGSRGVCTRHTGRTRARHGTSQERHAPSHRTRLTQLWWSWPTLAKPSLASFSVLVFWPNFLNPKSPNPRDPKTYIQT